LLLNDGEIARGVNDPLQGYRDFLLLKYNFYKDSGVGAADFVQAAGNLGTVSCPGGPAVKTVCISRWAILINSKLTVYRRSSAEKTRPRQPQKALYHKRSDPNPSRRF